MGGIFSLARWSVPVLVALAVVGCADATTAPRETAAAPPTIIAPLTCTGAIGFTASFSCKPLASGPARGQVEADSTVIVTTNSGPVLRLTIPSVTVSQGAVVTFVVNWSITNVSSLPLGCTVTVACLFNIPDHTIGNRIFIISGPFNKNGGKNPGINNKDGTTTIGQFTNVPYWQFTGIIQPGGSSPATSRPMSFNLFLPGQIPAFTMDVGLEVVNPAGS